jgi:hypothetical protein
MVYLAFLLLRRETRILSIEIDAGFPAENKGLILL